MICSTVYHSDIEFYYIPGKKHWDAQVIVIDMHPPSNNYTHSKPMKNHQLTNDRQLTSKSQHTTESQYTSDRQLMMKSQHTHYMKHHRRFSSSLGVLLNLDLTFMRPKLIFVRLIISSVEKKTYSHKNHEKGTHHLLIRWLYMYNVGVHSILYVLLIT